VSAYFAVFFLVAFACAAVRFTAQRCRHQFGQGGRSRASFTAPVTSATALRDPSERPDTLVLVRTIHSVGGLLIACCPFPAVHCRKRLAMNDVLIVLFILDSTIVIALAIDRGIPNTLESAANILETFAEGLVMSLRKAAVKLRERHAQIEATNRQNRGHSGARVAVVPNRGCNAA
jgi:hypothetical protein